MKANGAAVLFVPNAVMAMPPLAAGSFVTAQTTNGWLSGVP